MPVKHLYLVLAYLIKSECEMHLFETFDEKISIKKKKKISRSFNQLDGEAFLASRRFKVYFLNSFLASMDHTVDVTDGRLHP